MSKNIVSLCVILWMNFVISTLQKRYDGAAVVRLNLNKEKIKYVNDLIRKHRQISEWGRHPSIEKENVTVDVLVEDEARNHFWNFVDRERIQHEHFIPDVQRLIDAQTDAQRQVTSRRHLLTSDSHHDNLVGRYPRLQEILEWLYRLAGEKPDLVTVTDIGTSTENRPLRLIKISSAPRGQHRPSIWIDAAVHAREWIGPATAIYIIDQLVHNYGVKPDITRLVDHYDWYILPIANPDGYEYSHTSNRLWRKTRSRYGDFNGVDLNRNFDFHWKNCSFLSDISSVDCFDNSPAYDVYAGPRPFSEPESLAMARFLLENGHKFLFYFSLHAYAQFWLVPWAHSHVLADDFVEMMLVAEVGTKALNETYGTTYVRGPPAIILYQAGGTTMDWAKGVAGIKYSYILELRDTGKYGFLLPEEEILPTANETMIGISAVLTSLSDPKKKAEVFNPGRGKRRVQTLQRYKRYLEQHVSSWGGVNRSYAVEDYDAGFEEYFNQGPGDYVNE